MALESMEIKFEQDFRQSIVRNYLLEVTSSFKLKPVPSGTTNLQCSIGRLTGIDVHSIIIGEPIMTSFVMDEATICESEYFNRLRYFSELLTSMHEHRKYSEALCNQNRPHIYL